METQEGKMTVTGGTILKPEFIHLGGKAAEKVDKKIVELMIADLNRKEPHITDGVHFCPGPDIKITYEVEISYDQLKRIMFETI